jgi:aminopeptidase N
MRLLVRAGLFALLLLAVAGEVAAGEAPNAFATTPGRLPKTVLPSHYRIDLRPDLAALTFAGSEEVDIEVTAPTGRIVLNAVALTLSRARLDSASEGAIVLDAAAQTATLSFPDPIAPGRHRLAIEFTGAINNFGRGLFKVDYPTASGQKRMLSTHLEPADARRIFPSWDEPAFKASFEPVITVPDGFLAISNMPVAHEEPIGPGLKKVSFAPTPTMSSYLFVLAAGEFDRISGLSDGVEIGVVTTRGKAESGRYALESAIKLLHYYNDYFDIRYPLPKLDLIAVPGGPTGAMENWGGITFFESRLLFDPANSPERLRRDNFVIIAHEMAHQWFGNLVTMAWWDDLWLNEGFATWMEAKAAEQLNPGWTIWLDETWVRESAMDDDAGRASHPVRQPIADESEALTAFDRITYLKGRSFVRQLEAYVGAERFRDGIRHYMAAHAYRNAASADLWRALEEASGEPVSAIAIDHIEQPGLPLIAVNQRCDGGTIQLHLTQQRFTSHYPNAPPLRWQIPVLFGSGNTARLLMKDTEADISAGPCGAPVKLNPDGVGYYRTTYDADTARALTASFPRLSAGDKVNLLADSWALVQAGTAPPSDFLVLADRVQPEDGRAAWESIIRTLVRLEHLERLAPRRSGLELYGRQRLRAAFDRLGWQSKPGEELDVSLLRPTLIRNLGDFGDADILAEAHQRYAEFRRDPARLDPDLRSAVLHLVGRGADRATWDELHEIGRKAEVAEERVRYYFALASVLDPVLARETLAIALTDELPSSLCISLLYWVAGPGEHPELVWDFVQQNFAVLSHRFGPSFRDQTVAGLMANFSDRAHADELARFVPAHETAGGRIAADRAVAAIIADAEISEAVLPAIDAWIAARAK